MAEKDIQKAILQYLALKRIVAYRMNTGALRVGENRYIRFGSPGMADILAFTRESVIWIEVKGPKGRMSEDQKRFRETHEQLGHVYVLARDLSDVSVLFEKG